MVITPGSVVFDDKKESYKVLEGIGSGAFGYVYKVQKQSDNSIWALKTLPSDFSDETLFKSFINEGKIALEISHKNVVKYIYFHDGSSYKDLPPYIIMEYANQGTLKDLIKKYKKEEEFISNETLKSLFNQLIDGMEAINSKLIHRDIKPDNILISDNIIKISDFGLSKIVIETTRTSTFKGFGALRYMAPEGWKSEKNTIQMDIYSMGIVFYELSTLLYPFQVNEPEDIDELKKAHFFQHPKSPDSINSKLSHIVIQLIIKMMKKNTTKRFNSWSEVRDCLLKDSIPKTENDSLIGNMLKKRLDKDSKFEKERLEAQKRKEEIDELKDIVKHQLQNEILNPLKEFIQKFNEQYQSDKKILISDKNVSYDEKTIEYSIGLISRTQLSLKIKTLVEEDFIRTVEIRTELGRTIRRKELRFPKYNNKKIRAWGFFKADNGEGFNLILLENEDELYGTWYILINTNSGISRIRRELQPFAFGLDELVEEIHKIKVMHIYNTEVESLNLDRFFELINKYN